MKTLPMNFEGIEPCPLHQFTRKAYLDYSMYVILDRALPSIADGLKPVQRRIVYAMSELGLRNLAKYKKSARTVGDVLGKYHPHGDLACYEAMVLMAQPFSYRYPLVDGQGNFGSLDDPKSFAAMRYTESRLSVYADLLLAELDQGTVEWTPNFDGTLTEPVLLPAQVPNILLNGGTGIAVGMATDIPPHHLGEVVDACVHLLQHPKSSVEDLMEFVQGPDYPTGAEIITPRSDILEIYKTGSGSIKQRAVYHEEEGEIVITALPYQTSGSKVLEQIAAQMQAKKLPMVTDLRDESAHETPVRLVIVTRSNRVEIESLMAHLFATTDLEKNYRVNLNMIGLDGRPRVKNLSEILGEWLEFRLETLRLRLTFRLNKVLARLHILEGLLIAYLNLDELIHILRNEEEPRAVIIERFKLTEIQADAILDTKLRHLAKLEEFKIQSEQNELNKEKEELETLLSSPARMKTYLAHELKDIRKRFTDARRSPLVVRQEAKAIAVSEIIPSEAVTIVLSKQGWIRAGKGSELDGASLQYKAGDGFLCSVSGRSNQMTVFLDSTGRSYSLATHQLPSARGQGEPLTGHLNPAPQSSFVTLLNAPLDQKCVVGSDAGYGFICRFEDMICKNKAGKGHLKLPDNSQVLPLLKTQFMESDWLVLISRAGRLLCFPITELPEMSHGKGNKTLTIHADDFAARKDYVAYWALLSPGEALSISSAKQAQTLSLKDLEAYRGERGRRGQFLPNNLRNVVTINVVTPTQGG